MVPGSLSREREDSRRAVLALSVLTGCDDLESYAADQASLADAIAQAAKEAGK